MRPGWCRKATMRRMSRRELEAVRVAGRRKVLILGSVSAKIMEGLLPGQRIGVLTYHSTGRPERREGVSFLSHDNTGTNVERNFKTRKRGSGFLPNRRFQRAMKRIREGRTYV